jgi:transposase
LHGSEREPVVCRLPADLNAVRRYFRALSRQGVPRACYEASGAGYVLQRRLTEDGFACEVIAPSLIPCKPGERRKTDRLDAIALARLFRSGELTAVASPSQEQEAVRQLLRTRYSGQAQIADLKRRLVGVLACHGHHFTAGRSHWTQAHRAWLKALRAELTGPLQIIMTTGLEQIEYLESQQRALDMEIERLAACPPWRTGAEALRCFRGIQTRSAMTLLTEIGDIRRFRSPRGLMAYTGLVPTEHSSGERQRRGNISKSGNTHLRRVLVESAWHYHHRSGAALILERRRLGQPPEVVAIAVKAQHRLQKRFWQLRQSKHNNKAVTAVARELCGFVWAALMAVDR